MEKIGIELKWAALISFATCVWGYIERQLGFHEDFSTILISILVYFLITIVGLFFAFWDKKKNYYHGKWSFGEAFKFGMFLTGMLTILTPICQYIIYEVISPDYFENLIAYRTLKYPNEAVDYHEIYSMETQVRQAVVNTLSVGVVFSSLFAYLTKSKNYEPTKNTEPKTSKRK